MNRARTLSRRLRCVACGAGWLLVTPAIFAEVDTSAEQPSAPQQHTTAADAEDPTELPDEDSNRVDRTQLAVSTSVNSFARWIDAFFANPTYEAEDVSTRLELRPSATFSKETGTDVGNRITGKINLPNLSKRLALTFSSDDYDTYFNDNNDYVSEALRDNGDDGSVGLEYVYKNTNRLHTSLNLGVRLGNPSVYLGPRVRYEHGLSEHWLGRYTERVRWDTDDGWDSSTRAEFFRLFDSGNLFRQTIKADWREDRRNTEGMRYTVASTVVQRLSDDAALSYDWASIYTLEPKASWTSHTVYLRLRRRFLRDWAFIEVGPFVSFEDRYDWQANPGLRLSLDIIFQVDEPAKDE